MRSKACDDVMLHGALECWLSRGPSRLPQSHADHTGDHRRACIPSPVRFAHSKHPYLAFNRGHRLRRKRNRRPGIRAGATGSAEWSGNVHLSIAHAYTARNMSPPFFCQRPRTHTHNSPEVDSGLGAAGLRARHGLLEWNRWARSAWPRAKSSQLLSSN